MVASSAEMSLVNFRSNEARRRRTATSSPGTKVRRAPSNGTKSATGRPSTVIRMRSPASTSRNRRLTLLRSSRCAIVFIRVANYLHEFYATYPLVTMAGGLFSFSESTRNRFKNGNPFEKIVTMESRIT